jgi:cyanate lyase
VTRGQLAEAVGRPLAWTTAALHGQHPMTAEQVVTLDGRFPPYQY